MFDILNVSGKTDESLKWLVFRMEFGDLEIRDIGLFSIVPTSVSSV